MGFRDELVGLSGNQTDDDVMYGCIGKGNPPAFLKIFRKLYTPSIELSINVI